MPLRFAEHALDISAEQVLQIEVKFCDLIQAKSMFKNLPLI